MRRSVAPAPKTPHRDHRPMILHRAEALACEMYRYDEDVVSQGAKTLSVLAATLMVSDWWFFWWD
jgi:hypothetical protein